MVPVLPEDIMIYSGNELSIFISVFQVEGPPEYIFFSATRSQFNYDLNEEMMAAAGRTPFCIETATWNDQLR